MRTLELSLEAIRPFVDGGAKNIQNLKTYFERVLPTHILTSIKFIEAYSHMHPLRTLGVIKALIQQRIGKQVQVGDVEIAAVDAGEFAQFIKQLPENLPVVVCLDEFNVSEDLVQSFPLILLRNLLRSCPVVPVLLGTNSKVSNLVGPHSVNKLGSRGAGFVWCRLVVKLPRFDPELAFQRNGLELTPELKAWILKSPFRPGLTLEFLNRSNHADLNNLKNIADQTFIHMVSCKPALGDPECLLGYFQMIFSKYHAWNPGHNLPSSLIHKHLAHVLPNRALHFSDLLPFFDVRKMPNNQLQMTFDIFTRILEPVSIYLDISVDELLQFIILMGFKAAAGASGKQTLPQFVLNDQNFQTVRSLEIQKETILSAIKDGLIDIFSLSFRAIVEYCWKYTMVSDAYKSELESRSGNMLECLATGTFVRTSASCGPAGSTLETFLPLFASELQLIKNGPLKWSSEALDLLGNVKDQIVPCTLAAGYTMSAEFRAVPGVYTGSLPDLPNKKRLDGCFIPDWFPTLVDAAAAECDISTKAVEIAKEHSKMPLHQLFVTLEEKNLADTLSASILEAVLIRACANGRSSLETPFIGREDCPPLHHVHLIVCSSLAKLTKLSLLAFKNAFSETLQLLRMTFDEEGASLGLVDLFDFDVDEEEPEADVTGLVPDLNAAAPGIKTNKKRKLKVIPKTDPATKDLPRSTIIIIPIEQMFSYPFTSTANLMTEEGSLQVTPKAKILKMTK